MSGPTPAFIPSAGGSFGGVKRPPLRVGRYYIPHWAVNNNTTITLTANRLYRTWIFFDEAVTLAGAFFYNSGVGDNGKKLRIGLWNKNSVLVKDFGETTLSGASALRSVANSVSIAAGAYEVGIVSDTGPVLYAMGAMVDLSGVGFVSSFITTTFGQFSPAVNANFFSNVPVGEYAAFTYAALPDPITTATVTVYDGGGSAAIPLMGVYL